MNTLVCVGSCLGVGRAMCERLSAAGAAVCLCCALFDTGGLGDREEQKYFNNDCYHYYY